MSDIQIEQPITSVEQGTMAYLGKHPWLVAGTLVLTAMLETGGIALFIASAHASVNGSAGNGIAYLIVPLIVPIAGWSYVSKKIRDEFMRQFAEANGYTFSAYGGSIGMLDGTLFHLGNGGSQSMTDVVSGTYLGNPISLFSYSYETGSGKSRRAHYYTVFQLQFDTVMPDLLLERKAVFSSDTLLGQLPEHVKLEGDFNKYFSLSIKKGYEVEALEIFTPDVMAVLEEKCKNLSLEIVNSHLFIYDNTLVSTKADLDALYGVAQYFAQELGPVLARMKGSAEAMEAVSIAQ